MGHGYGGVSKTSDTIKPRYPLPSPQPFGHLTMQNKRFKYHSRYLQQTLHLRKMTQSIKGVLDIVKWIEWLLLYLIVVQLGMCSILRKYLVYMYGKMALKMEEWKLALTLSLHCLWMLKISLYKIRKQQVRSVQTVCACVVLQVSRPSVLVNLLVWLIRDFLTKADRKLVW